MRMLAGWLTVAMWGVAAPPPAIRIQVTAGGHEHALSFYRVFEGQTDFDVRVNPHPTAFRKNLTEQTDVVVLYDMTEFPESQRPIVQQYLEAGKGLVVLHHALADNQGWPWWWEEVTGGRYLLKAEGSRPASTYKHDIWMQVKPVAEHPVVAGVEPFRIFDEGYKQMWFSPRIQVLATTDNEHSDSAVVWIGPWQRSRVVVIQLGHGPEAHDHAAFRQLVRNAIRWTAKRP